MKILKKVLMTFTLLGLISIYNLFAFELQNIDTNSMATQQNNQEQEFIDIDPQTTVYEILNNHPYAILAIVKNDIVFKSGLSSNLTSSSRITKSDTIMSLHPVARWLNSYTINMKPLVIRRNSSFLLINILQYSNAIIVTSDNKYIEEIAFHQNKPWFGNHNRHAESLTLENLSKKVDNYLELKVVKRNDVTVLY